MEKKMEVKMYNLKSYKIIWSVIIICGIFVSSCSFLESPEKDVVYGPGNPDPYPAHYEVAVLDSVKPITSYPTDIVTVIGSGFETSSKDKNFVWFQLSKADVINAWTDSLLVEVPLPNKYNPDYFFDDTVEVKVALQGSYNWSNTIPFVFKPMVHAYEAKIYPGTHTESKFTAPRGLEFDNNGNIYLMNQRTRSVYKDTPEGERTVYAFGAKFDGGLRFGPDGYLYAAGNTENSIYRIPSGGNSFEQWVSVPNPWGMDFDEYGNLFVVDKGNGHLYRITSQGVANKVAELPGSEEKAYCRVFENNIYITANGSNSSHLLRLQIKEDSVGEIDTVQINSKINIADLTFSYDGSIYFSGTNDKDENYVYKLDNSNSVEEIVGLSGSLGFLTWFDKFIYISNHTGSVDINDHVYKVLIHDSEASIYHGR
jgi:hypothetical protein